MKKALITGITGQDGSYLAELLLSKGYEVHGIVRRSSSFNTQRIDHLFQDPHDKGVRLHLHFGDMTDSGRLTQLCYEIRPDEIYNLAAQSHVRISFDMPEYSGDVDALGTLRLLEAIRASGIGREVRFYQASTSELYGKVAEVPQRETTPFHPRSPYAVAKLYSYWAVRNYREAYGLFASNGILFNHESPRRGQTFVTRKITLAAARIKLGLQDKLYLGNIDALRDWGYAGDYVEGMWRILQRELGKSSWFGFSMLIADDAISRRDVLTRLAKADIETRPIGAGNFARKEVVKWFDCEIPASLPNADYVDRRGFFVGNHQFDISDRIAYLKDVLKEV